MVESFKVSTVGVEGIEEREQIGGCGRLGSFEEQGPKPIGARTGIGVHTPDCQVNLLTIESSFKMAEVKGTFRVKLIQREIRSRHAR